MKGLHTEFFRAEKKDSKRLMIMLHGLGDSLEGYRWLPETLDLPYLNYLLVNGPDEYYGGYSWYDFTGNVSVGVARSRDLLFALLDEQRKKGYPTEQTVLGGFSQGCLMSIEVGLRYPHLFAAIVGISGYVCAPELLLKELSPVARQQKVLVTHGFMDPIIPFAGVKQQIDQLKTAGIKVSWHEFVKAHTIAGEQEIRVIRDFIQSAYRK